MNELTDLAYAAGYIDGDGCFYLGRIKSSPFYQDAFSIVSTHKTNIEWFDAHFSGTIQVKNTKQKNRVTSYHFVFTKEGYQDLPKILPFLIEKNEECKTFLEFRNASGFFEEERKQRSIDRIGYLKHWNGIIHSSIKKGLESIRNTIKPTTNDFAYLAGYIDAECSLDISRSFHKKGKNPCYRIQLQCNNTKSPFFYWTVERFGGQFHFLDKSHIPNRRNQMLWRLSCKQLLPILEGVCPFLKHKKQICGKMIEFQKTNYIRKGAISPNSPHYANFYEPIHKAKESIYLEVRHLNNLVI